MLHVLDPNAPSPCASSGIVVASMKTPGRTHRCVQPSASIYRCTFPRVTMTPGLNFHMKNHFSPPIVRRIDYVYGYLSIFDLLSKVQTSVGRHAGMRTRARARTQNPHLHGPHSPMILPAVVHRTAVCACVSVAPVPLPELVRTVVGARGISPPRQTLRNGKRFSPWPHVLSPFSVRLEQRAYGAR